MAAITHSIKSGLAQALAQKQLIVDMEAWNKDFKTYTPTLTQNQIDQINNKINKIISLLCLKRAGLMELLTFNDNMFEIKEDISENFYYYTEYFLKNLCLDGSIYLNPIRFPNNTKKFDFFHWFEDDRNFKDFDLIISIRIEALDVNGSFSTEQMEELNNIYKKWYSLPEKD